MRYQVDESVMKVTRETLYVRVTTTTITEFRLYGHTFFNIVVCETVLYCGRNVNFVSSTRDSRWV